MAKPAGERAQFSSGSTTKVSWWGMLKQTFHSFNEDKGMRLAAALSLYIILSLAPLLIITLKVVSKLLGEAGGRKMIQEQVSSLVGNAGTDVIKSIIDNSQQPGSGVVATVVSILILLYSASNVFGELQDSLNTIWRVKLRPDVGWWDTIKKRFLSVAMVLIIAFLLLTSLFVTTLLTTMSQKIAGDAKWMSYPIDIIASVAVVTVMFAMIFRVLPDVRIGWRDVLTGALVTAVLFKLGQYALAVYFKYGTPTSAYGAFGSLVAVMLWGYYSSIILFVGAEFTKAYAAHHGRRLQPDGDAVVVTESQRSREGMPSEKHLAAIAGTTPPAPRRKPDPATLQHHNGSRPYAIGVAGAAAGAVAAGLATYFLATDKKRAVRQQVAAQTLDARLAAVESKLGRVHRIKGYLDRMDVKDRIDRIDHEIQRAGRHIRATETGRPPWMVRLGDLIGGRWSNL